MDKRTQTEALWKRCFGDSDEFIRLYFNAKYDDGNTPAIYRNGQMASVLQIVPYSIRFRNRLLSAGYISGACTAPEARNQGLMRQLLAESLRTMHQRYMDVSFLIPQEEWLYTYYAQSGYSPQFTQEFENYHIENFENTDVQIIEQSSDCPSAIFELYEKGCAHRNAVVHNSTDFHALLDDLYLSGGKMLIIGTSENPRAMALALPDDHRVRINELIADTEDSKSALINEAAQLFDCHDVTCITPLSGNIHGMIRIVNTFNVLQMYAQWSQTDEILRIIDPIINENTATYHIHNGECSRIQHDAPTHTMDISELADLIFQKSLFINLMFE